MITVQGIVQDLNETDYDTTYEAMIEVEQRGFIDKENKTRIKQICSDSYLSLPSKLCIFKLSLSRHVFLSRFDNHAVSKCSFTPSV